MIGERAQEESWGPFHSHAACGRKEEGKTPKTTLTGETETVPSEYLQRVGAKKGERKKGEEKVSYIMEEGTNIGNRRELLMEGCMEGSMQPKKKAIQRAHPMLGELLFRP